MNHAAPPRAARSPAPGAGPLVRCLPSVALAVLALAGAAQAQSLGDLHGGVWKGTVAAGFTAEKETLDASGASPQVDFTRQRLHERLDVENNGFYYVDPMLATGNAGVDLDVVQDHEAGGARRARLVGYEFDASLFSFLPYNGRLYANRAENQLIQPFGHTDLTLENRGAVARLREDSALRDHGVPFLSGEVSLEQQHSQETTTSVLGQTFHSDQRQDTMTAGLHKGFLTSDLDFSYQMIDVADAQFPTLTFRSNALHLADSLDFGGNLNHHLDSRLYHYERNGSTPMTTSSVEESLRDDIWQNLGTLARLVWTRTEVQGAGPDPAPSVNTTRDAEVGMHYEPWRNLYLDNQVAAVHQDLSTGQRDTYSGQFGLLYRKSVAGDGMATGRLIGRYQVDDNRLTAAQIQVVDEQQVAPALLGAGAGFDLGQPFAAPGSVMVLDARGGARIPTTLGLDYEIVSNGNLTRIVPLATSAVIRPGDPLLVSYLYLLDPSIRYSTASQSIGAGLELPWLSVSYGHDQSAQHRLSGAQASYLEDMRKDTAQLQVRRDWNAWHGQADLGYVHYDATLLAYRQQRAGGLLSWRPQPGTLVSLTVDRTDTDFGLPSHRTVSTAARLGVDWFPPGTWPVWSMTAALGHRIYQDTLQPTELIDDASVRLRMSLGKLEFTSALTASERSIDGYAARNYGLELAAVRAF